MIDPLAADRTMASLTDPAAVAQMGVLFDLDGTLVDTAPDLVAALNLALNDAGFASVMLDEVRHAASHGSMALVRAAKPSIPDQQAYLLQQSLLSHYAEVNGRHCQLFEGIAPLLDALGRAHIPYGIVTNKAACFARPLIERIGLASSCRALISGDSVTRGKPDAAPMLLAASQLNRAARHIVYLGDAKRDMEAARAAHMTAALASWGYISAGDDIHSWPVDVTLAHPLSLLTQLGL